MARADAAIVGYGETDYDKEATRSPLSYLREAISAALVDAGLGIDDVDGLSITSHDLHRENEITLANHFGISGRWFHGDGTGANAAPVAGIIRGARSIAEGRASTVIVAAGDASTPASLRRMIDSFNGSIYDYMRPYGFGGANGIFALIQQRHAYEYGTTRAQLASIPVTQREHALANPRAIFDEPLSREEYLEARPIVEPVHLYDCVLPCGGAGAIVLTSRDTLETLDTTPVFVQDGDEYHDPNPTEPFPTTSGFDRLDIFDELTHDAIDAVQLYDNYPIWVAVQLEDLGFCAKGNGGAFVAETDLSIEGELPLNTGGGQLSVGQANGGGGILPPIEAIRQLRGEGGNRQVSSCETVLATGFGMVAYGGGLSHSAVLLSTSEAAT